jgi:uncharacterized protein YndB with AHSA1/START domain
MKEMLVYRFEEFINAPIDIVFAYVDEDEKIKRWNTMMVENIYDLEEGTHSNKPGTRFKSVQKIEKKTITVDCMIMEYQAPTKIVMHSTTKEGVSISKYFLLREYHGTRLIVEASLIPSNTFYKITTKLLGWTSKLIFEEQYQNLKAYVENEIEDY